jgi:hypothetical protein
MNHRGRPAAPTLSISNLGIHSPLSLPSRSAPLPSSPALRPAHLTASHSFAQPPAQSPRDSAPSSKHFQPSDMLMSHLEQGGSWAAATSVAADTEHWADFAAAPEQWSNAVATPDQCAAAEEWAELKFDSASISIVVSDVDWAQSNQDSAHSSKPPVEKRTIFLSLSRVLKLFKSQSRSALLQRAFYTWHNLLRMRERRRWVTCFCQKMQVAPRHRRHRPALTRGSCAGAVASFCAGRSPCGSARLLLRAMTTHSTSTTLPPAATNLR